MSVGPGTAHVVGAGLAGLAAAVELAAAGRKVCLYEAGLHAGGRCRSYFDTELGCRIDNGNHLLLAGNDAALRYLDRSGGLDTLQGPQEAVFPFIDATTGQRWVLRPNRGVFPWWISSAKRRVPETRVADYLAAVALRRGDMDSLAQTADQIIHVQPASPDGYVLRAVAEINRKQISKAEEDIRKAIEVAPQNPAGYVQTGNLRLLQKQYGDAEKYYQQALDRDPNSSEGLSGLMNAYLAQKQTDKAVAAANAQLAKVPNSSAFHDLLGTILFNNKKDMKGAEKELRKAAELDKNNSDALLKLGQVQVAQGSVDQAIATYQRSLKNNPREIRFYILIGELYESKQDWEKAKQMYQKALEIQPDNPLASNNLAYVMLQQGGNVDVALSMAQTARRGMPDSSNAADTLGWAYFQKGAYNMAIDLFKEALKKSPEEATYHYHLGLAYQKAKQPALAKQHLERVLKINPKYMNADEVRKALAQLG